MGIIPSRNLEEQRREKNGVTYFDRGVIEGKDGRKYSRYAIQTHFVKVGEDQAALVEQYVRPLYQPGDVLSFGAKVMCMCVKSVKTRDEVKPGWWANHLWRFAGINHTGVGMHEPYKLQLVIDMCGLPRVLLAAFCSAVTKLFGKKGVFYKVCGHEVDGIDGLIDYDISFKEYVDYGILNPENPSGVCDEIYEKTGVKAMIEDNRYCGDVLTQLAAAESAVRRVSEMVLAEHMRTCVVEEVRAGNDEVIDEVMALMRRFSK